MASPCASATRGDGRRTLVTPTPAAAELAARLREGRQEHILAWLGALTDAELEGLTLGFRGLLRIAAEDAPSQDAARGPLALAAEVQGG